MLPVIIYCMEQDHGTLPFYFPYLHKGIIGIEKNLCSRFFQNFMFQTMQIPENKVFHFRESVCPSVGAITQKIFDEST